MSIIEIDSIYKTYQDEGVETEVLKGISMTVEEGDYISIVGPSGAGKSTLMTILGCLAQPTSGTYLLDGVEVEQLNDQQLSRVRNEKIGFVFQAFHLLPGVSALDNVMMPLLYCHTFPEGAKERVERALKRIGLGHRLNHTPGQLSGGEQQRVTIARSLINDPKILFADDPTGNLDPNNGAEIMATFDQLNTEGRTIIVITHDLSVAKHARRILTLRDGQIESDQTNENFKKSRTSPARAAAE
jgi:putative ABC transport system ATP-binding protein